MIPALFTRISILSVCFFASDIMVSIASGLDKSTIISLKAPPLSLIIDAVSSQLLLATPRTFAPAEASAIQIPCPSPVFAPVTKAVLSVNEKRFMIGFILLSPFSNMRY